MTTMTKRRFELLRNVLEALEEFDLKYPNEGHCVDVLFDWMYSANQILCVACSAELRSRIPGTRYLECSSCSQTTWFTAGSFFHKAKKIRERFAVKWLMEKGVVFNSSILKDVLNLAGSTAWELFHEINSLIADKMKHDQFPVLSSAHFREVISKRSNLSKAAEHPRAELDEVSGKVTENSENNIGISDEGKDSLACFLKDGCGDEAQVWKPETNTLPNVELKDSASQSTHILPVQEGAFSEEQDILPSSHNEQEDSKIDPAAVIELLRTGPCSFDKILHKTHLEYKDLCTVLCLLEISGKVERGFGDVYSLPHRKTPNTHSLGDQELGTIHHFTKWIKDYFGGISLKYLQNYLAYFWCVWDKKLCCQGESLHNLLLSSTRKTDNGNRQSPSVVEVYLCDPLPLAALQ